MGLGRPGRGRKGMSSVISGMFGSGGRTRNVRCGLFCHQLRYLSESDGGRAYQSVTKYLNVYTVDLQLA